MQLNYFIVSLESPNAETYDRVLHLLVCVMSVSTGNLNQMDIFETILVDIILTKSTSFSMKMISVDILTVFFR